MDISKTQDAVDFSWKCGRADVIEFLLVSDLHLDSTKTDRSKVKKLFDAATSREVLHLQLGTAKESHKDRNSWEAHKGFGPPSLGGFYLKFFFEGDTFRVSEERVCF